MSVIHTVTLDSGKSYSFTGEALAEILPRVDVSEFIATLDEDALIALSNKENSA